MKIPKVGVALVLIVVVTVGPIAEMHCPSRKVVSTKRTSVINYLIA